MPQPLSAHVVAAHLERVRKNAPLTHVITNAIPDNCRASLTESGVEIILT